MAKDQSYVLHMLSADDLERVEFPVGDMEKSEVRQIATDLGMRVANKPDSQDVCFIASTTSRGEFLGKRMDFTPATVVDETGAEVGHVDAVETVTIGQRKGLGLAGGTPAKYVNDVDVKGQRVTIGPRPGLLSDGVELDAMAWIGDAIDGPVLAQTSAHGTVPRSKATKLRGTNPSSELHPRGSEAPVTRVRVNHGSDHGDLDALRIERDDWMVQERGITPPDGAVAAFELAEGPFRHWTRTVTVDADTGTATENVDFRLATPGLATPFGWLYRWALRRPHADQGKAPFWAPPQRFDAVAARAFTLLIVATMAAAYLGTLLSQTITFVADDFNADRSTQGIVLGMTRIGALLALLIVSAADRNGRRRMLVVAGIGSALFAATAALSPNIWFFGSAELLSRGFATGFGILIGIFAAEEAPAGSRAWTNEYLRDERGFSGGQISLFSSITSTPIGIGVAIFGPMADRRGRRVIGAIGIIAGVVFNVVRYGFGGPLMWIGGTLSTIIGAAAIPALGVYGPEMFPTSRRGLANGLLTCISVVGSVIGLYFVGPDVAALVVRPDVRGARHRASAGHDHPALVPGNRQPGPGRPEPGRRPPGLEARASRGFDGQGCFDEDFLALDHGGPRLPGGQHFGTRRTGPLGIGQCDLLEQRQRMGVGVLGRPERRLIIEMDTELTLGGLGHRA
ncbi:tRNA-specific 2-thiouridylase MnmA [Nymphon striatum]|nr:tRNA-specific 2-thiouridylase MnmA [Nymphon striatum]